MDSIRGCRHEYIIYLNPSSCQLYNNNLQPHVPLSYLKGQGKIPDCQHVELHSFSTSRWSCPTNQRHSVGGAYPPVGGKWCNLTQRTLGIFLFLLRKDNSMCDYRLRQYSWFWKGPVRIQVNSIFTASFPLI